MSLTWQITSTGSDDTIRLGALLANKLPGGSVIELTSDLGGGKTTFTRGLAQGLGSSDTVSSPTFTLKKIYKAGNKQIYHYDFYRLSDPGILRDELAESLQDAHAITVVEWSDIVRDVLPAERISIKFAPMPTDPDERLITISYTEHYANAVHTAQAEWEEVRP